VSKRKVFPEKSKNWGGTLSCLEGMGRVSFSGKRGKERKLADHLIGGRTKYFSSSYPRVDHRRLLPW